MIYRGHSPKSPYRASENITAEVSLGERGDHPTVTVTWWPGRGRPGVVTLHSEILCASAAQAHELARQCAAAELVPDEGVVIAPCEATGGRFVTVGSAEYDEWIDSRARPEHAGV